MYITKPKARATLKPYVAPIVLEQAISALESESTTPVFDHKPYLGSFTALGIEMVLAAEKHNYKLFCELLAKTEYMDKVQLWRVLKACNRHFRDTGSG